MTNIVLLELRIAQMIKTMLKGNAGSLNKTYEVPFPSRLHRAYYTFLQLHTLLYDFVFIYIDYIHCYMIFFIYTLIIYIGTIHVVLQTCT